MNFNTIEDGCNNFTVDEIVELLNVAKSTIRECSKKYGEECQYKHTTTKNNESDSAAEIRRLNQGLHKKIKRLSF